MKDSQTFIIDVSIVDTFSQALPSGLALVSMCLVILITKPLQPYRYMG